MRRRSATPPGTTGSHGELAWYGDSAVTRTRADQLQEADSASDPEPRAEISRVQELGYLAG